MSIIPFKKIKNKLRIVILKDVSQFWSHTDDERFKHLFHKMIQLKLHGYNSEYPEGVLPVDTTDFIADHLLVCKEEHGELTLLSGTKSTTVSVSQKHLIKFPGLSLVQASESKPHIAAMENLMKECAAQNRELTYTASWAITPEARKDKSLRADVHEYFNASYVFHHMESKIQDIVCGGTIRFKVESTLARQGHAAMCANGERLDPLPVKHLFGEKVQLLHLKQFTPESIEAAHLLKEDWDNRIEMSAETFAKKYLLKVA